MVLAIPAGVFMSSILHNICTIAFFAVALLYTSNAYPQAEQSSLVMWYVQDFPPISIINGAFKGKGWADIRIERIIQKVHALRHERVEATSLRLREDQLRKGNICSANMLRTAERENYVLFSNIALWVLPNGLITTRLLLPKLRPFINENGEVSLEDLLASQRIRVSITPQRSFGREIDEILQRHTGSPAIVSFPSSNHSQSRLLKLANQESIDAMIAFDVELRFLSKVLNLRDEDFVFLPIKEATALVPTYIGCSRSTIGKAIIDEYNKLLADPIHAVNEQSSYERWLTSDGLLRYRQLLADRAKR